MKHDLNPDVPEAVNRLIQLPVYVFAISFGIGTLLLVLHFVLPQYVYTALGIMYILFAIAVNLTVCIVLGMFALVYWPWRQIMILRACLLFVNIPIAMLYVFVVSEFSMSNQF